MNDQDARSGAAAIAAADEPATYRLVIRARIITEELSDSPAAPHAHQVALPLVGVAALAALIWIGVTAVRTDSPSTSEPAQEAQLQSRTSDVAAPEQARVAAIEPARSATHTTSTDASSAGAHPTKSVPAPAPTIPDGTPLPIEEVRPDPAHSALQTIRGTIRVAIRVTIDPRGLVVAATSHEPGPSRYFERLSLEASKKWTFAPAATNEQRTALLRFHFTREGTTARATPLQ